MQLPIIPLFDEPSAALARQRQSHLTKPAGSLGRLEELSIQLAGIQANPRPQAGRKAVIVRAGDHGVVAEGVSAYPSAVTSQMVYNFLNGGAAINVLARQAGARVTVVDVGVATDFKGVAGLVHRKVAPGTHNMALGPALTRAEAEQAVQVGIDVANAEAARGLDMLATGEMGIGNTTPSSAITALYSRLPVSQVVGRGTGVDDSGLSRKISAIQRALEVNQPDPSDPLDVLAKVGGLEIAGLAGVVIGAAANRVVVVIDGFISTAAALIAVRLAPETQPYLIAAHQSVEAGHLALLRLLGLRPLLDLDLRLGEGTGAVLAFHLLEAAAHILNEMATFESAGVSGKA